MLRAIVVDDIAIIRSKITSQINESNLPIFVTGVAENGQEAVSYLDSYYADVCITDIKMPVMDGLELIRIIRGKYPWMVSLVISSYDEFEYARKSIQLDAVDYILKPVDQEQLEEALGKAVSRIDTYRNAFADSILLTHRSVCDELLEHWLEYIRLDKSSFEELIQQTADKICKFTEDKVYLMPYLAKKWINSVSTELNISLPEMCLNKYDTSTEPLLYKNIMDVSLQCCHNILQNGLDLIQSQLNEMKSGYQRKIIDKLVEYIHENYMRSDFTLQEMADYVSMSKNYLSKLFKQEMKVTIWNYIIDLRMKKAKDLLSDPNTKNFEVAESIGYTDYIHFSRLFKQYNGISAQEYRKRSGGL